jgi:uncharacterized protein (TIGR02246 family)
MTIAMTRTTADAEIRACLEAWTDATRAKDVDRIIAAHAPDTRSFDCHSHFQLEGAAALRRHLDACTACMQGPMTFEIHGLDIAAQGDLAFAHFLARFGATGLSGRRHDGWLRVTVCLRRIEGRWLIVHDHCSAPFDPETGKAFFDFEPSGETLPAMKG